TLPNASPSVLAWFAFAIAGQLSFCPVFGALNPAPAQIPSLSWSSSGSPGHESHASPSASPSALAWPALARLGQLSHASPAPSPSASACVGFETDGQLSRQLPI